MKIIISGLSILVFAALSAGFATPALAQYSSGTSYESTASAVTSAPFVKKRYSIKGSWNITEENGQKVINFSDDFKTKGGPDLKVFLTPESVNALDSQNVTSSSLKLSVLKSTRGSQSYVIPADVNLSDYKSVVIHCEAFSVLWGGFDL